MNYVSIHRIFVKNIDFVRSWTLFYILSVICALTSMSISLEQNCVFFIQNIWSMVQITYHCSISLNSLPCVTFYIILYIDRRFIESSLHLQPSTLSTEIKLISYSNRSFLFSKITSRPFQYEMHHNIYSSNSNIAKEIFDMTEAHSYIVLNKKKRHSTLRITIL